VRRLPGVGRLRLLGRRVQILLALAVVAATAGAVGASGASFVSASSFTFKASTTALSGDTMSIVAGNHQSAINGTELLLPLQVKILDSDGRPVSNLTVTFAVATGGGSIVSESTDDTGLDGVAEVRWKLGPDPGGNTLTAYVPDIASPRTVTFDATATAGRPVSIAMNDGDGQRAVAGTVLSKNPSVKVSDAGGHGCPNVSVTFAVTAGGGSIVNGSATVATDQSGIASAPGWKLGPLVGANMMTAANDTLSGSPVEFNATGTVGSPSKVTIVDGNGQTAQVGTTVNKPLRVRVADANDNPCPDIAVTFTPSTGSGSITGSPATTDASGVATSGIWTLGTDLEEDTLTAGAAGATPATFKAYPYAGSPKNFSIVSGTPQTGSVGATLAKPIVQVTDAYNNGVEGVGVVFQVTGGNGTVNGGQTVSVRTGSDGSASPASWVLGTTAGTNTLTATCDNPASTLTFTATGNALAASRYVVTSGSYSPPAGSPVTITAQLADTYGNPIAQPGLLVTFTSTGGGKFPATPATATTGPNGAATIQFTTATLLGTKHTVSATSGSGSTLCKGTSAEITTTPAVPAKMVKVAGGDGQSATVNTNVATAPSVIIYDAYNNVVPGVTVTFAVTGGAGKVGTASAVTNASGVASCGSWTLGTKSGANGNTLTATLGAVTGSPATFTATGTAGAATQYIVAASSYTPAARSTITLTAQLADQYGNAVATSGIPVSWTKTGASGSFGSTTTNTNTSGIATTTYRVNRVAGGTYVFTARSTSGGTRTGSSATVTIVAAAPTRMSVYAGNNQTATVGTAVATAPSVRLRDQYGNYCANQAVTFAVTAGGGTITTAAATTDASGVASCGAWTLGTKVGANTLTATRTGLTTVTFTATGVLGPAAKMTLSAGAAQSAAVGTAVAARPSVLVTDVYDNPVPNLGVTFALGSGGGTITGGAATTGTNGIATVGSWTLGTTAGTNTLTATRAGLTGSPVTFTATGLAGAPTKFLVTASDYNPPRGSAVTIAAQLADQYNNPVTNQNVSVTFTRTPTTGTLNPVPVTTVNGLATTIFTTAGTVTSYTVTATSTTRSGFTSPIVTH
jgi:adhesin/invasin